MIYFLNIIVVIESIQHLLHVGNILALNLNGVIRYHSDFSGSGLNALKRDREFAISFLNEFQDRLYYGQDICTPGDNIGHTAFLDELLENGDISQEVYNKVCWQNAVKLLNLDLTEKDFML